MKTVFPLVGMLLVTGLVAQEPSPAPSPDAKAKLEELQKEVQSTIEAWQKEMVAKRKEAEKAKEEGDSIPAIPMRPDLEPLVAKYAAAAEEFSGTDDAVPFLVQVLQYATFDRGAARDAVTTLAANHAASPAIADIAPMLEYLPQIVGRKSAKVLMTAIREKNKDADVLGWIALTELGSTIDDAALDSDEYADAKKTLLAHMEGAKNGRLKSQIQAKIDLRERLGVGNVAPDIAGIDLDGVEFKLSDYKGKVVVLDFWGDW